MQASAAQIPETLSTSTAWRDETIAYSKYHMDLVVSL